MLCQLFKKRKTNKTVEIPLAVSLKTTFSSSALLPIPVQSRETIFSYLVGISLIGGGGGGGSSIAGAWSVGGDIWRRKREKKFIMGKDMSWGRII